MATVPNFYTVNEIIKPTQKRCHHNDDRCGPGKDIPLRDMRNGTGGYRLCEDCQKLN